MKRSMCFFIFSGLLLMVFSFSSCSKDDTTTEMASENIQLAENNEIPTPDPTAELTDRTDDPDVGCNCNYEIISYNGTSASGGFSQEFYSLIAGKNFCSSNPTCYYYQADYWSDPNCYPASAACRELLTVPVPQQSFAFNCSVPKNGSFYAQWYAHSHLSASCWQLQPFEEAEITFRITCEPASGDLCMESPATITLNVPGTFNGLASPLADEILVQLGGACGCLPLF